MTAVAGRPAADLDDAVAGLARRFVTWLETGTRPTALFDESVFVDLSLPHWRLQADGAEAAFRLRESDHPFPGTVRVECLDRTSRGFLIQFEERWTDDTQSWYCRELIHAVVDGGLISELAVYCTGDWDEDRQRLHAEQVHLSRP